MSKKIVAYLLITLGIVLFFDKLLDINVNLLRIFISVFLIYIGYLLIQKGKSSSTNQLIVFGKDKSEAVNVSASYTTIFGERDLFLNQIDRTDLNLEITTIFGETRVYIPKDFPLAIYSNTAFGESIMPNLNNQNFGDLNYLQNTDEVIDALTIKSFSAFAEVRFISS